MANKRVLALVVALIAAILIILAEMGTSLGVLVEMVRGLGGRVAEISHSFSSLTGEEASSEEPPVRSTEDAKSMMSVEREEPPGLAVQSLLYLDLLLMTTVLLFVLPLVFSPRLLAMVQGFVSVILGIVVIVLAVLSCLMAVVHLLVMVNLLLAVPFGTIAYMILYAGFDTGKAAAIMSTLMTLKLVLVIGVVVAQERFLVNTGFVALAATSFLAMVITSFLHNLPPSFLVSITDGVAALLVNILTIIWGLVYIFSGITSIVTMLKGLGMSSVSKLVRR